MNHGFAISDWSADLATAGAAVAGELEGAAAGSHAAGASGGKVLLVGAGMRQLSGLLWRAWNQHLAEYCFPPAACTALQPPNACLAAPACALLAAAAREQVAAAAARRHRIANRCDLRVYAVTDPDCNAMFGRSNAGAWVGAESGVEWVGGSSGWCTGGLASDRPAVLSAAACRILSHAPAVVPPSPYMQRQCGWRSMGAPLLCSCARSGRMGGPSCSRWGWCALPPLQCAVLSWLGEMVAAVRTSPPLRGGAVWPQQPQLGFACSLAGPPMGAGACHPLHPSQPRPPAGGRGAGGVPHPRSAAAHQRPRGCGAGGGGRRRAHRPGWSTLLYSICQLQRAAVRQLLQSCKAAQCTPARCAARSSALGRRARAGRGAAARGSEVPGRRGWGGLRQQCVCCGKRSTLRLCWLQAQSTACPSPKPPIHLAGRPAGGSGAAHDWARCHPGCVSEDA